MGLFNWFRKSGNHDPIYSVMNDDHALLYQHLGQLRTEIGRRCDDTAARTQRRRQSLELFKRLMMDSHLHFRREEELMEMFEYPKLAAHRSEHQMLLRSAEMYYERLNSGDDPISEDAAQYLKTWLSNHIRTIDRELERFLLSVHRSSSMSLPTGLGPSANGRGGWSPLLGTALHEAAHHGGADRPVLKKTGRKTGKFWRMFRRHSHRDAEERDGV